MRIESVRIRNFRTIADLSVELGDCTVLCGPNSVGKTNVLEALRFALSPDDGKNVGANLPHSARGPRLTVSLEINIADVTPGLAALAKGRPGGDATLTFRATRNGAPKRILNGQAVEVSDLLEHVSALYVPPIRDLNTSGTAAFQEVFAAAIKKARGARSMSPVVQSARKVLRGRADIVLSRQREVATRFLNATRLEALLDAVTLDDLYQSVRLAVRTRSGVRPLSEFGTGHQSAVIVHLFRQIADAVPGLTLLLLEEPDNHLHPQTMRSLAADVAAISRDHQVLLTTHSPLMIDAVGIQNVIPLQMQDGKTVAAPINLSSYQPGAVRRLLQTHNLRATEPLLANRVVLVEGPFDKHVLSALIESRLGRTPEDMGLLVVAGTGKASVADLAEFVDACGLTVISVVDFDAAHSDGAPRTSANVSTATRAAAIGGIQAVEAVLDLSQRRGRDARANLNGILSELQAGPPTPRQFTGSYLERLLTVNGLTVDDRRRINSYVAKGQRNRVANLARSYDVLCWTGTLEQVLMRKDAALDIVEQTLIAAKAIPGRIGGPTRRRDLEASFKKQSHEPDIIVQIVREMDRQRLFSRTEINSSLPIIIGDVS